MKITVKEARRLAEWLDYLARMRSCKIRRIREAIGDQYVGAISALRVVGLEIRPTRRGARILHGVNGHTAND